MYRLLSHRGPDGPVAGVLIGERVVPAAELLAGTGVDGSSVRALVADWDRAHPALAAASAGVDPGAGTPPAELELLAPLPCPGTIYCAGANYWDHLEEMDGPMDRSRRAAEPWFFVKASGPRVVVGDRAEVAIPAKVRQLDWEAELAVVIGREARHVDVAGAPAVIAGYTILNDLSARDLMRRADRPPAMAFDWVGQKCFDGAAPMGPWLTPAAAIDDPHDLDVRLWVNGELKQDSNTRGLIHDVYEQIAWLSGQLTLLPGDVVATGTPAGVGLPRGEFLGPGDVVRVEIEGCGTLTTTFTTEARDG